MTTASPAPVPDYTIVAQHNTIGFNTQGNAVAGWQIDYSTPNGNTGSIFVPNAQYNLATVKELIEAQVQTMAAIHQLGTGS